MTSNKEHIENLEHGLSGLQDLASRLELGMADKLQFIEENLQCLSDTVMSSREASANNSMGWVEQARPVRDDEPECGETGSHNFYLKVAKLEFFTFASDDPMEWFNRVMQIFEFQDTIDNNKVTLTTFHLEG